MSVQHKENSSRLVTFRDVENVGPGTLAGDYLRLFWQPVFHSHDLDVGQAKPIRILGEDFTLYRGESGDPFIVASRCAHRGMPMHAGWVEGDEIRCFYHGWKYNGAGQCIEQPGEPKPFCDRVQITSHPTREYLGLIFAYFGPGEPPEFPRYPKFEGDEWLLAIDSYVRPCHFFNNLENACDTVHVGWAHHTTETFDNQVDDFPEIFAEEKDWGAEMVAVRPNGKKVVSQFAMPNLFLIRGVPDDPEVGYREFFAWWVPHDDNRHTQFTVAKKAKDDPTTDRYMKRRAEKLAQQDLDHESLARAILAGEIGWNDIDPKRVNLTIVQDHVAQIGVGLMAEREEVLGLSDRGVSMCRQLWVTELQKLADGEPLTDWRIDLEKFAASAEY